MSDSTDVTDLPESKYHGGNWHTAHAVMMEARAASAFEEFKTRLAAEGSVLIEDRWLGGGVGHPARCRNNHIREARPNKTRQGRACDQCRRDALHAERAEAFRLCLAGQDVTLLEPYKSNRLPHKAICSRGHICYPYPQAVSQGRGFCRECAGKSPEAAERKFRELVTTLGGTVTGPWVRSSQGVHCVCAVGHDCYPQLGSLAKGQGLCRECGGTSPAAAEREFRRRLTDDGAYLLDPYRGSTAAHRVICPRNHVTMMSPAIVRKSGAYCDQCPDPRSLASERAFIIGLAKHGATYVGPWTACDEPVALICSVGHHVTTRPLNVARGNGPCRICAGKTWDVFYVVTSGEAVKFGITSGDPRPRLANHADKGYGEVVRVATGLPGTLALDVERAVKQALADAGEKPVRGREYFDISCLALILDVADSWLQVPDSVAA